VEEIMIEKKKLLRAFLTFSAALFACCLGQTAQAAGTTVAVGSCKAGLTSYPTIQKAVDASPAGTTIDVCPGTYPEQVSITKNLTLTGVAAGTADAPTIVPPTGGLVANASDPSGGGDPVAAQIVVTSPATSVIIQRLTVDGANNQVTGCASFGGSVPLVVGIYFLNVSGTITQNAVRNQLQDTADQDCPNGLGIYVETGGGATTTVTISNNTVRNYQQNGITANGFGDGSAGPAVTITNNTVPGTGATATSGKNGIQIGFGATGQVTGNITIQDIYALSGNNGDAGVGILVFASTGITISNNVVGNTQFGIVTESAGEGFLADTTSITGNKIIGTELFDGIDLCSNGNTVTGNTVNSSTEAGIHLDDSCGSTGNNNTVKTNNINEACAGILTGTGTSGNVTTPNTIFNVINTTMADDTCTAFQGQATAAQPASRNAKHGVARISPYPPRAFSKQ
jgi:parallel beta-helix repeat protein